MAKIFKEVLITGSLPFAQSVMVEVEEDTNEEDVLTEAIRLVEEGEVELNFTDAGLQIDSYELTKEETE